MNVSGAGAARRYMTGQGRNDGAGAARRRPGRDRGRWAFAGALLACLFSLQSAAAGTLSASAEPGCDYEFRGMIEPGDAAALEPIGWSYDGVVLCMDSPGGAIREGLEMFRTIRAGNIITRVPAGWRCESSCAVAFMAGSIFTGLGVGVFVGAHRLDPGGTLGFHAPGLAEGGQGSFSHDEVARAFAVAVEAAQAYYLATLEEEGDWRPLNEFLYARIVGTPFDRMYRIETIGDAVLANLTLGPIRLPARITAENIVHLCDAAWLRNAPFRYRVPEGEVADAWRRLRREGEPTREYFDVFRAVTFGRDGDDVLGYVSGYDLRLSGAGASMTGCELRFALRHALRDYEYDDWVENGAWVQFRPMFTMDMDNPPQQWWQDAEPAVRSITVPLWYMHAPDARLDALAPQSR